MVKKVKVFVPGGLQKSVQLAQSSTTTATQIEGFGGQILSIAQLKVLLGLSNPNTVTTPGQGGSTGASITVGPGLQGGGPVLGNVKISLLSPGQGMIQDDPIDNDPPIPGPAGQRGQQGLTGPPGAVFLLPDEADIPYDVVPGPRGLTGPQGPTGPSGTGGSGPPVWLQADEMDVPYDVMPGPRGLTGATGPTGPIGLTGSLVWLNEDVVYDDLTYIGGPGVGGGASISFANPTGTIGLIAVNGSALTAMRSDAAPALSQAIAPTWTGAHIFSGNPVTITEASPSFGLLLKDSGAAANAKITNMVSTGGFFSITGVTDAVGLGTNLLVGTRSGADWSAIAIGNTTDYPTIALDGNVTVNVNATQQGVTVTATELPRFAATANGIVTTSLRAYNTGPFGIAGTESNHDFHIRSNDTDRIVISASGASIQGYGPVAAGLVDMTPDTGTFTITYTGMLSNPTGTAKWVRVGSIVHLLLPALTGTSSGTSFTATGLPTAIQPATTQQPPCIEAEDVTTSVLATATFTAASGTITFTRFVAGSSLGLLWTASGTKGIPNATTVCYSLN